MGSEHASGETTGWRTIPNLLTALRILLVVPLVYCSTTGNDFGALGIWIVAGLTDVFDGYLARRWHQSSKLGRLADPVADKLLTGVAFLTLAAFRPGLFAMPRWIMVAVIGRDVLILAGCLVVYRLTRSSGFRPTFLGKTNTLIEILLVTAFLASSGIPPLARTLPWLYGVTLASIIASMSDYVLQGFRMVRDAPSESALP